jgi:integrase
MACCELLQLTLVLWLKTHATRMWEGGMRELTLQKRLGHASPESTRIYTQVSDPIMVAEYQRALGEEVSE